MARGNARQDVFLDEADRELLIENPEGRLVSGMRRLNGAYTQDFNRRHGRVGHLSQVTSVLIGDLEPSTAC